MSIPIILGIAVALAMDAFAIAVGTGIRLKQLDFRQRFRLSWHFGFFQAMMPVIGWGAGLTFRNFIAQVAHWIAFGLLTTVGMDMLRSAAKGKKESRDEGDPTKGMIMVMLSVATSLDALAVGLSLSVLNVSIWLPVIIIGIVAGSFTLAGLYLGERIASALSLGRYAEAAGGVVLLIIGINILYKHGTFSAIF